MEQGEIISKTTLSRLKAGDMAAFDSVYRTYAPRLYRFAIHLLKNASDAEGIVQEVFLKLWQARSGINLHSSFESYLFTITHNTVVSQLRKRASEKKFVEYVRSIQSPQATGDVIAELELVEMQEAIQRIVDELPARQQEVFRLSREKGLTYQEIAQELQLSVNTVENHMGRALKYIRSQLSDYHHLKVLLFFYLFSS